MLALRLESCEATAKFLDIVFVKLSCLAAFWFIYLSKLAILPVPLSMPAATFPGACLPCGNEVFVGSSAHILRAGWSGPDADMEIRAKCRRSASSVAISERGMGGDHVCG